MEHPDTSVWADILAYVRSHHAPVCRQWFDEIEPLGVSDGAFTARVPRVVWRDYLDRECAHAFTAALQAVTGELGAMRFETRSAPADAPAPAPEPAGADSGGPPPVSVEVKRPAAYIPAQRATGPDRYPGLPISPDFSFEHFVEGPENRLALAAARAVCDKPGVAYNPLFIHGGVGLGKTHLLQAICLSILDRVPDASIYYTSCEGFMTQFMDAVQAGEMAAFRHRFRDVDVLMIDDIHFLAKRDRTQEEFFHTFNALYQARKQIVLSSDAPPQEIPALEDRLVSRFQCGLVAPVNPPGFDTRVEIIRQKCRMRGMKDVKTEVASLIAGQVDTNIRELEGVIVRLHMLHSMESREIDEALALEALGAHRAPSPREITIEDIIEVVVDYFGVRLADLQSKRRQKSIAHPRQICMYLARKHTRYSLEEIGGYFGGRDHTTVMHAQRTIASKRDDDHELHQRLTAFETRLGVNAEPARSYAASA
jgi:chromosomal replication initiator protein